MLDPLFTVLSNHRQQSAPEGRYVFPSPEMLYRHYGKFIRNRKGKKGRTAWAQFGHKRAMHLNPVPSTSISCHGGLPPHPRRIRGPVYDGGRLPCISGSDALANRVSLPPMHCDRGMGYKTSVHAVRPGRPPSLRHGRRDLSPEPPPPAD